jgi:hypothetical protein
MFYPAFFVVPGFSSFLDAIKDSMKKYGVNRFLASKPYLQNENFPSNEEHITPMKEFSDQLILQDRIKTE